MVQPINMNYVMNNANTKDNGFDAILKMVEIIGPSIAQSRPIGKKFINLPLLPENWRTLRL